MEASKLQEGQASSSSSKPRKPGIAAKIAAVRRRAFVAIRAANLPPNTRRKRDRLRYKRLSQRFVDAWTFGVRGVLTATYEDVLGGLMELYRLKGASMRQDVPWIAEHVEMRNGILFTLVEILASESSGLTPPEEPAASLQDEEEPLWHVVECIAKQVPEAASEFHGIYHDKAYSNKADDKSAKLFAESLRRAGIESLGEFWTHFRLQRTNPPRQNSRPTTSSGAASTFSSSFGIAALRERIESQDLYYEEQMANSGFSFFRPQTSPSRRSSAEELCHGDDSSAVQAMAKGKDDVMDMLDAYRGNKEEEQGESNDEEAEDEGEEGEASGSDTLEVFDDSGDGYHPSQLQRSSRFAQQDFIGPLRTSQANFLQNSQNALRCHRSYRSYKEQQRSLQDMPSAFTKPRALLPSLEAASSGSSGRRPGLALNRLPGLPPATPQTPSSPRMPFSLFATTPEKRGTPRKTTPKSAPTTPRARKLKDRLKAEQDKEVLSPKEHVLAAAQQPSRGWGGAMRTLASARESRSQQGPRATLPQESRPSTGIMASREDATDSLPQPDLHRPWSREGAEDQLDDKSDGLLSPVKRYAEVCRHGGIVPQQDFISYLSQLPAALDFRGRSYSDEDVLALSAALPYTPGLEVVDLGDNPRLTDRSVCGLLKAVESRYPSDIYAMRFCRCTSLGRESLGLLTQLLKGSMLKLGVLDLSGVPIGKREYPPLAAAVESHPALRELHLADTGLGFMDQSIALQVVSSLTSNLSIQILDLGYNNLGEESFEAIGHGVLEGHFKFLGLASTVSKTFQHLKDCPMHSLLEQLPGDECLTELDISNNLLNPSSCLMLEYALRKHPCLQRFDISNNALGQDGLRCLVRLFTQDSCPELLDMTINNCQAGESSDSSKGLFDVDPSGAYSLDMSNTGDRVLFRLLLCRVSELGGLKSSHIMNVLLNGVSYSVDNVKSSKRGFWQVPSSGILTFDLNLKEYLLQGEDPQKHEFDSVVERMYRKRKLSMATMRKTLVLLTKVKTSPILCREDLINGIAKDFHLTPDQVLAVCGGQLGSETLKTLVELLPCLSGPWAIRQVARATKLISELIDFEKLAGSLLNLNLENSTGHYELDLSHNHDRCVVQKLLLLNRWQLHLWRSAQIWDVSQDGNGKCFRNATLDAHPFVISSEEWRVQGHGEFSFDWVPFQRPPKGAEVVSLETWGKLLAQLRKLLGPYPPSQAQQQQGGTSDILKPKLVTWALRGISARVWITARQLRSLLCFFLDRQDRMNMFIVFFLRCVDGPVHGKICEPKFTREEWGRLIKQLGHLTMFQYFQPELSYHTLDLAVEEQRKTFHVLLTLASAEHFRNIREPMIDRTGPNEVAPHFENFEAGIPVAWETYDNIDKQGVVQCGYACSIESVSFKTRYKLSQKVGGWTSLAPAKEVQSSIKWWSVLDNGTVLPEVIKTIVFMIHQFGTLDAAFSFCNEDGDTRLTHKEFVDTLAKAGCLRSKPNKSAKGKNAKPGLTLPHMAAQKERKLTPAEAAEFYDPSDTKQHEQLSNVYRYLDTSLDGDISRAEFGALERIWNELRQAMHEFKMLLAIHYGKVEDAYWDNDHDDDRRIGIHEFEVMAARSCYKGPYQQIFMFLDYHGKNELTPDEFMLMDEIGPPLPDFEKGS
eukprot:TRINITY_DN20125_c0_g1_i1.p1 TRINITY_DN20125_c0_g1~~TRINITY_DN20125_c0_g1_i1.p1  ORF type:complete len:1674 (+),score=304.30 TRINITY_DN20125_c0_g1_i1:79-5022(+)